MKGPFFLVFTALWAAAAYAARFGSYLDKDCAVPFANAIVFTDVCTWSSNQVSGSYAAYLTSCSSSAFDVVAFNLTGSAGCNGTPLSTFSVNAECVPYQGAYVKGIDFTCDSGNTTYNVLAHFAPRCEDGGFAFSMDLGDPGCLEGSFGPGLWNWDAQGEYAEPYYSLTVFNSTDGTCQDETAEFQTKEFPAQCLSPSSPFQNISIDIFPAFPVPT
jgi:hypothetical protein